MGTSATTYLNLQHFIPYAPRKGWGLLPSLSSIELSRARTLTIPEKVAQIYRGFRPTPLRRLRKYEAAIGSTGSIWMKDEGETPCGNHKINAALLVAHAAAADGVPILTTETTGYWGEALAIACRKFGLGLEVFLDAESCAERPKAFHRMTELGAVVHKVAIGGAEVDRLLLSADAAITHTLKHKNRAYIFGSVYGYFVVAESVVGLEARTQLQEVCVAPDFIVGSCGGGANLLGLAAPFLVDRLEGRATTRIVSAESRRCPILSKGFRDWHGVDERGYCPEINTFGLRGLNGDSDEYVGGLASTIVASAAAAFTEQRLIEPLIVEAADSQAALRRLVETEGWQAALETGYTLAAVEEVVRRHPDASVCFAGTRVTSGSILHELR